MSEGNADFIGKEGVRNTCRVKNKRLIKNLRTRKKLLGKKDRIFSMQHCATFLVK